MPIAYRGRFAPSPTGALHFGSLVAAVGSWLRARANQGTWLVRIEDLDPPREVPGSAAEIIATLAAFGMESDEPIVYQSRRAAAYDEAFARLRDAGAIFPCWCSRGDLESTAGLHRGNCQATPDPMREPAWRVRAPDIRIEFDDGVFGTQTQNLREHAGDFVIRRADGWYAYQLAVVIDDDEQQISEIVRGADLLDSTPRQIFLQQLLGLGTPAYAHLPLVLDEAGRKLSKQDRARPVDRHDPLAALQSAIAFLGFADSDASSANSAAQLLENALERFDWAALKATARSRRAAAIAPTVPV